MAKENANFDRNLQCGDRVLFKEAATSSALFGTVIESFKLKDGVLEYYVRPEDQAAAEAAPTSWSESDDDGNEVWFLCVSSAQADESIVKFGHGPVVGFTAPTAPADPTVKGSMPPNPKKLYGAQKPDLSLIPPVAQLHQAMAFENGASKYGAYNWRDLPVEAMTYIAAAKRHLDLFLDGQDYSSDANVHNLGHVMACCAILLDSQELGCLLDNRPKPGASEAVQNRLKAQKAAALAAKLGG